MFINLFITCRCYVSSVTDSVVNNIEKEATTENVKTSKAVAKNINRQEASSPRDYLTMTL
jgi:hypothetical protein